jgi:hypothetical protein
MHRVLFYITVGRRKIQKADRTPPRSCFWPTFIRRIFSPSQQPFLCALKILKKFQHLENRILTKHLVLTYMIYIYIYGTQRCILWLVKISCIPYMGWNSDFNMNRLHWAEGEMQGSWKWRNTKSRFTKINIVGQQDTKENGKLIYKISYLCFRYIIKQLLESYFCYMFYYCIIHFNSYLFIVFGKKIQYMYTCVGGYNSL